MPPAHVEPLFRRPVLVWLLGVGAGSLVLGLALIVVQPEGGEVLSHGADSFSRSALGHRALVDLLRGEGVSVLVSRHSSASRASDTALLMLA